MQSDNQTVLAKQINILQLSVVECLKINRPFVILERLTLQSKLIH